MYVIKTSDIIGVTSGIKVRTAAVVKLITQEVGMDRLEHTNNTHSKVRVTLILQRQMIILASFTAVLSNPIYFHFMDKKTSFVEENHTGLERHDRMISFKWTIPLNMKKCVKFN